MAAVVAPFISQLTRPRIPSPSRDNPHEPDRTLCYAPKNMNLAKILAEFHDERRRVDEAIEVITRLAAGGKRRGRPPKWMAEAQPKRRGRPHARKGMSATARQAQYE